MVISVIKRFPCPMDSFITFIAWTVFLVTWGVTSLRRKRKMAFHGPEAQKRLKEGELMLLW